jgi:Zn-dependent protease with chaperone function
LPVDLENRVLDETVNYSTEHPLREFAWLALGALGTVALLTALVGFFAGAIAARLPFSTENEFAAGITKHWEEQPRDAQADAARQALREIAAKLVPVMNLPPGMRVNVHYSPDDVANAFATLGGNVVFYRGLLVKFDSEDAVATVLAHEIAHAKLRHPASSLGRGIAVGLTLSLLSTGMGEGAAGGALQTAGTLPLLKYSRDQESAADAEALAAVARVYGHLGGAQETFAVLSKISGAGAGPAFLQTHPLTADRLAEIRRTAQARGWTSDGARTPLPPALAALKTDNAVKSGSGATQ